MYVQSDLHRTAQKTRWISPKGFNVTTRHEDLTAPNSTRNSFMQQSGYGKTFSQRA
jgi:hypothetical protein